MGMVTAAVLAFIGSERTCLGVLGILALFPGASRDAGGAQSRATVARSGADIVAGVCFVLGAVAVAANALNDGTALVFAAATVLAFKFCAEVVSRGLLARRA